MDHYCLSILQNNIVKDKFKVSFTERAIQLINDIWEIMQHKEFIMNNLIAKQNITMSGTATLSALKTLNVVLEKFMKDACVWVSVSDYCYTL